MMARKNSSLSLKTFRLKNPSLKNSRFSLKDKRLKIKRRKRRVKRAKKSLSRTIPFLIICDALSCQTFQP